MAVPFYKIQPNPGTIQSAAGGCEKKNTEGFKAVPRVYMFLFQNPNTPNLTSKKDGGCNLIMWWETGSKKAKLPPQLEEDTAGITDYTNVAKKTSPKSEILNQDIGETQLVPWKSTLLIF